MVKGYCPLPLFPSISITGDKCGLKCKFCEGKVLSDMVQASSPHNLYELVKYLNGKYNILGLLISGGFDSKGFLPIKPFIPIIRDVKRDFDLVISVHCGFVDADYAKMLRDAGIDIVDLNIYGPLTMRDIVGIDVDWNFVEDNLKLVYSYGPNYIAPHILAGAYFGKLMEENYIINLLKDFDPYVLIFLSMIPVKGTSFENVPLVDVNYFCNLFRYARKLLSKTELALGCMRVRGEYSMSIEKILVNEDLLDRIVLPNIVKVDRILPFCCSLPRELEDKLISKIDS
ncbi:MAG: radical SAM protein [Candidatus Methanomethylicia archaeon]